MLSLALTLLLSAAAPEAAASSAPATTNAKPAKVKKVCRTDDNTGSRLKRKTCKTQEEWDNQPTDVSGDVRVNPGAGRR